MSDLNSLQSRLDQLIESSEQQAQSVMQEAEQAYEARQQGYEKFLEAVTRVRQIAKPRLELLAQRFNFEAETVHNKHNRGLLMKFDTKLANVTLQFTATHDADVRNLVIDYDLHILPIFVKFDSHSQFECPLDHLDEAALAQWFDDQIVAFSKTYLEIQANSYYQKDHMVTDPVAEFQFPKVYAQATLEKDGQTYYFISEKTRDEFLQKE